MASKSYDRRINLYINGKEVKNDIASIKKEMYKLTNEQARMTRGSKEYNQKTKEIRKLRGILREHNQSLRGTSGMWQKIKGILPIAGFAALGAQIIRTGKELFNLSKEMEADSRRSAIVFGNSLGYVEERAAELSEKMGVTNREFVAMATATGDLLIPLDFSRQQAAEMSVELQKLTGALDEWTGGSIGAEEVSNILTKAMLGENEQLKQLGIAIRKDTDEYRDLVKLKLETTGATKLQAEAMATLELIQKKSADAQAAYEQEGNKLLRLEKRLSRWFKQKKEDLINFLNGPQQTEIEKAQERQKAFNTEIEILEKANFTQEERARKIQEINDKYGAYMTNLLDENATLVEIKNAQQAVNKAFAQKILFLQYEEELKKVMEEQLAAAEANYDIKQKEIEVGKELQQIDLDGKKVSLTGDPEAARALDTQMKTMEVAMGLNQAIIDGTDEATKKVKEKYDFMAQELGSSLETIMEIFNNSFETSTNTVDEQVDKQYQKFLDGLEINNLKMSIAHDDFLADLERQNEEYYNDYIKKQREEGEKAAESFNKSYSKEIKDGEKKRKKTEQLLLEDKYNMYVDYATRVGSIIGEAFANQEMTAKEAAKGILLVAIDSLRDYARIQIAKATIGSLASAESIATFGVAGAVKAAVLTGLIEAALGAVKGAISGWAYGGYTGPGGKYKPAGIVHAGEWVANADMVASPETGPIIRALEEYRVNSMPGYADGGPAGIGQTDSRIETSIITDNSQMKNTLSRLTQVLSRLERNGVRTNFTYKDVSDIRDGMDRLSRLESDVTM